MAGVAEGDVEVALSVFGVVQKQKREQTINTQEASLMDAPDREPALLSKLLTKAAVRSHTLEEFLANSNRSVGAGRAEHLLSKLKHELN